MHTDPAGRQLRILIFSPYLAPHVGGLESFVSELNDALLTRGDAGRITVFTSQLPPTAAAHEVLGPTLSVIRYPAIELIPNFPLPKVWTRAFWRALRAAAPPSHDVLVGHTRFFISSALALLVARLARRPLIHVEHGSDFVQLGSHFTRLAARTYDLVIGRLVLRRADAVVAVSRAAAEFVGRLARRESQVVYRGIGPHRLEAVEPDQRISEFAASRTVATFVGRLIDGKGVSDLLRAFAALADSGCVLCVVGDGPRRADLELLAGTLGITERVLFLGYLSEPEALASIIASDVIVNPSYTEGLPTTVLEAALLGRVVLATDVGGTGEIVAHERSGILVPARDVAALSDALRRLVEDPALRERLSATAKRESSERFDWDASAEQFAELARLLAGPAPGIAHTIA